MDDISFSSNDEDSLQKVFDNALSCLKDDKFHVSASKLSPPSAAIDIFNCDLKAGRSAVKSERINKFFEVSHTVNSEAAFREYCKSVEDGNLS